MYFLVVMKRKSVQFQARISDAKSFTLARESGASALGPNEDTMDWFNMQTWPSAASLPGPVRPRRYLACIAILVLLGSGAGTVAAQGSQHALLVGVASYASADVQALEGPANDVAAMRTALVERLGMPPAQVRTLVNAEATRVAIIAELNELLRRSKPGDTVLVYFSGHGTSALDGNVDVPLPHGSGAFAPYDLDLRAKNPQATLIVGRTDLRPVLEKLDAQGRFVLFISDSCYSGQQVRSLQGLGERLPARMIGVPSADDLQSLRLARQRIGQGSNNELVWPYKNVVFLSASAEGERAVDIAQAYVGRYPTIDGKAHGAMTDALLRVLHGQEVADFDASGSVSVHEMHLAVARFMAGRAYGHTPQRLPSVSEDQSGAARRALFSAAAQPAKSAPPTPVPFHIDASLPAQVRQAVAGVPGLVLAGPGKGFGIARAGKVDTLQITTPNGDRVTTLPVGETQRLLGQLAQLVWGYRLDRLAVRGSRAALQAEITPSILGGNFMLDDTLAFAIRPDWSVRLLLVNLDSLGKVSVLYPFNHGELGLLKANVLRLVPGEAIQQRIKVSEPLGQDVQFLIAFDADGPDLSEWINTVGMAPTDPRLDKLTDLLTRYSGRYAYARTEIRVLPKE
jgi:hypothetical protein